MKAETEKLAERIFGRVTEEGECWLWMGALNQPNGYGVIGIRENGKKRTAYVHRLVYEGFHGPIPTDHEVHHRCERKTCVNPDHLEAVESAEHRRQFHAPLVIARGVPCPRCSGDHWKQRFHHGHKNGWKCMDCHARSQRARQRRPIGVAA